MCCESTAADTPVKVPKSHATLPCWMPAKKSKVCALCTSSAQFMSMPSGNGFSVAVAFRTSCTASPSFVEFFSKKSAVKSHHRVIWVTFALTVSELRRVLLQEIRRQIPPPSDLVDLCLDRLEALAVLHFPNHLRQALCPRAELELADNLAFAVEAVRDVRVRADTAALRGHQVPVQIQSRLQLRVHVRARREIGGHDVAALADFAVRNRTVEVAVAALQDRLRPVVELLRREALVVPREPGAAELGVDAVADGFRDVALLRRQRGAEAHVDGDRMPVVHWHWLRGQLVHWRPGVPVRDGAALVVLEQIRALKLQHLLHALLRDFQSDLAQALRRAFRVSELVLDEVLSVLLEQLEALQVLHRRDLDELRNSVPHMRLRKRREQAEIDDHATVRVEGADAVLVLLGQVAAHLDSDGRVDHANQTRRESHVSGRAPIECAGRTADVRDEAAAHKQGRLAAHQTHVREEDHHLLHRLQRLLLLVDTQRQEFETHSILLEVRAHRLAVDVVHPRITDDHAATVVAEAIGEDG